MAAHPNESIRQRVLEAGSVGFLFKPFREADLVAALATAMTLAAAPFGAYCAAGAEPWESRELAALGRATLWVNSPRLSAAELGGKVVVVDFCTYSCINWLRTLPYRRAWAQKYSPGLVLIGVPTPEFGFEKSIDNVRRALRQTKLGYAVVIDKALRDLAGLRQQLLAGLVLPRRERTRSRAAFRRG